MKEQHSVTAKIRTKGIWPNALPHSVGLIIVPESNIAGAISALEQSLENADPLENAAWTLRLLRDTKRAKENERDEDERLDRLVGILNEFPADIAEYICLQWHRRINGVFTPTPSEIFHACEILTRPRKMILQRLVQINEMIEA